MIRTAICSVVLALLPTFGLATGCNDGHQAMSCAEGTVWDHAAGACVDRATS